MNAERTTCRCRRKVLCTHFDNDKADTEPPCCVRCQPPPGSVCCDICNPEAFPPVQLHPLDIPDRSRGRNKTKVRPYERGPAEIRLRDALRILRKRLGLVEIGNCFGVAELFLPDALLSQIVDLAHYEVLETPADLALETSWVYADRYGKEVVDVVHAHIPQVAVDSADERPEAGEEDDNSDEDMLTEERPRKRQKTSHTPAAANARGRKRPALANVTNIAASTPDLGEQSQHGQPARKKHKAPTTRRCGRCRQVGHIATNGDCPALRMEGVAVVAGSAESNPGVPAPAPGPRSDEPIAEQSGINSVTEPPSPVPPAAASSPPPCLFETIPPENFYS